MNGAQLYEGKCCKNDLTSTRRRTNAKTQKAPNEEATQPADEKIIFSRCRYPWARHQISQQWSIFTFQFKKTGKKGNEILYDSRRSQWRFAWK